MNTKNKLMTILSLSAGGIASLALMNKYIKHSATAKSRKADPASSLIFKWRFGNIHYTKSGSGKPILLIHELNFASSDYEWHLLTDKLSRDHTVYTMDLLGCGYSDKPNLTYTNYMFVQLLCDFIKTEIGHRIDVIATGESSSFVIMACHQAPELFNRLMLINPNSLASFSQIPGKRSKFYKFFLDLPIAGTLLYYIACSRKMTEEAFKKKYFYNIYSAKQFYLDRYFESAHLGECPKAIFSSMECKYTKCNISNALKKIDNSIYIIGGSSEPDIYQTIDEYKQYNPAIESSILSRTKHLPQLEDPAMVLDQIYLFFS